MRVLITGGGCEEPIDRVRYIGNFSTGRTASFLSDYFQTQGHDVTCLMSLKGLKPEKKMNIRTFRTFRDLESLLEEELSGSWFDAVIQAAAVSDYSVASVETDGGTKDTEINGKIDSDGDVLIRLKRNRKLIGLLRTWSVNPELTLVGFKLTADDDEQTAKSAVEKMFRASNPDYIVWNALNRISGDVHPASFFSRSGLERKTETLEDLAESLEEMIRRKHDTDH